MWTAGIYRLKRKVDRQHVISGTTWTKQKPGVVRKSAPFEGSLGTHSRNALREIHKMKEASTVWTAQWGPHPTPPLEAIDTTNVEVAATEKVHLVEICGARRLCNLSLICRKTR